MGSVSPNASGFVWNQLALTLVVVHHCVLTVPLQKASRRKSCSDIDPVPLAPLASQEAVDQLDGVLGGSEEDEEPDVVRISPRSDSPRG